MKATTARLVKAYLQNTNIAVGDLPGLIESIHRALTDIEAPTSEPETIRPAVPVKKSVRAGAVVCLECGRTMKMLKRHLKAQHGLTPDEYRAKWRLSADHPITSPDYAAQRSVLAKEAGLGRPKTSEAGEMTDPTPDSKPGHKYPSNRWGRRS